MRVFVTGASGFIGSHVVPELLDAGHQVLGLARSDVSAAAIAAAGAEVLRGDLTDLDVLRGGAASTDGTIHLAFVHDFDAYQQAAAIDLAATETIGEALAGSGRPFVNTSGTLGVSTGTLATEDIPFDPVAHPRSTAALATLALAARDVRASVVRLSPSVHSEAKTGFVGYLADLAGATGVAAYVGDGSSRWSTVHVRDAATLYRLVLEGAEPGTTWHGVGEEGIAQRDIAEAIGRGHDVPVRSVAPEEAEEHFAWMGRFIALDAPASSALTRERLGWEPIHPGLLDDLADGAYFA